MSIPDGVARGNKDGDVSVHKPVIGRKSLPTHPALNGVVDLTDTVDTDTKVRQLPAVTHEFVKPTEHHVTHQHITREIHNYDVFHRILPVIDLEILPTKHYIIDPGHPGTLKEIPASEAPVKNNWSIATSLQMMPAEPVGVETTTNESRAGLRHWHDNKDAEPVLTDKRSYMTEEGFMRTEYFWKHAPTLDMTAYHQGKTVPFHFNRTSLDKSAEHHAHRPGSVEGKADLSSTTNPTASHVNALQSRAKESLAADRTKEAHDNATRSPGKSPNRTAIQALTTESSSPGQKAAEKKAAVAEEALAAAADAIAVAEEVVNTVAIGGGGGGGGGRGRQSAHGDVQVKSAGVTAPQDVVLTDKGQDVPPVVSQGVPRTSLDSEGRGFDSIREKMRARLHKAKKSVIEVGHRLRQH